MPVVDGGALDGVRVLDLARGIAGPYAALLLADWGADVIKVEGPDGAPFRSFGFGFLGWNRGKHSLAVDLKQPEGRALVHELVRDADVLVENFRPGVAARLSAGHETLHAINPRLIYSTETAYGHSGPYVKRAGFDPLLQALSGAMAAQQQPNDGVLAQALASTFRQRAAVEWLARLDAGGVPAGRALDGPALFSDVQIAANELIVAHDHPRWGRMQQTGQLVKFARTPGGIQRVAPLLGQHTAEVLREAGVDGARIADLLARGVIVQGAAG